MNERQATKILTAHNKWRRGNARLKMQEPKLLGEAIDVAVAALERHATAMDVLRQIADRKRRTQEQRLAKSCVVFLDTLPIGPPARTKLQCQARGCDGCSICAATQHLN